MTREEINNALKYALLALAAFSIGCATSLVPQLMDPTMPALNWRIVLGTGITALITAYGGAFLPRSGATYIAKQVDALKAQGTPRSQMVVLSQDEAALALAGKDQPFSPAQVDQISQRLLELRDERAAQRLRQMSLPPPPLDSDINQDVRVG